MDLQHYVMKGEMYHMIIKKGVGVLAEVVETGKKIDRQFGRDEQRQVLVKVGNRYDIVPAGSLLILGELIER